jgi:hypothetical protein
MSKTRINPLIVILLLGSFLVLSLISISNITPPEQCAVVNGQKIPLSAIPEGWKLSIIPLQIELTKWEFIMRDIKTSVGISDVHVFLECDALGQHGETSVYTDANGYAEKTVIKVDSVTIRATHPKYYVRSETMNCRVPGMYIDWLLTPLTEPQPPDQTPPPIPPDVVKVTLYGQVDKKSYVIIGSADVGEEHYGFDQRKPQRAVMWLKQNTVHSVNVNGWYNEVEKDIFGGYTGYNPVDFTYVIQIITTGEDAEYWINLQNGDVHTGTPPPPEDGGGGGNFWSVLLSWLTNPSTLFWVFGIGSLLIIVLLIVFAPGLLTVVAVALLGRRKK